MKSRPAPHFVGTRYGRATASIFFGTLAVLSVWLFFTSEYDHAAALSLGGTVPTAATLPTEPTVATVATVPTEATVPTLPPTTPTATATVTQTPVPSGDDTTLPQVPPTYTGNYCIESGGVGLTTANDGTMELTIDGEIVAAYLVWSGRYIGANNGDNQIKVELNGNGTFIFVNAEVEKEAFSGWVDRNHYTYRSTNLVNHAELGPALDAAVTASSTVAVKVMDLKSDGTESNQGHGIGMVVVYANPTCAYAQINLFYGLDGFHHRFSPPFGPNSEVVCVDVPAALVPQPFDIQLFVGGAEGNRPNAIWYATGSGPKPDELITNSIGTVLDGQPLTTGPALTANSGLSWDNYTPADYSGPIMVAAGDTFVCVQIESVETNTAAGLNDGEPPLDTGFDTAPFGTSGVWVSMASRLELAMMPTATATATATGTIPTSTPTATATATGTTSAPTATPTATATGTLATPTPTATLTMTPTTQAPTPTATSTTVGNKPNLNFTVHYTPKPPHPGMPLTFIITFQNGTAGPVKQLTFTVVIPNHTFYPNQTAQLRSAGWTCTGTSAGSTCTQVVGDVNVNASGSLEFPVEVLESVAIKTPIKLNVVGSDAEGNNFTGGAGGVDVEAVIEQVNLFLPYIGKNWSN